MSLHRARIEKKSLNLIISIVTYMHQQHLKCFLSDTDHRLKTKQITHRRTNMLFWMPVLSCFRWNDKTFFMCASRNHTWRPPSLMTLMFAVSEKFITFWHPSHLSNRSVTLEVCLTSFKGFFTQREGDINQSFKWYFSELPHKSDKNAKQWG